MALSKGPRSHRLQHMNGIPRVDRSIPSANSEPTERRMTFAEAVDQPEMFCLHTAAANYKPSETRDINPKRLQNCAAAGLGIAEIMHGFNCSKATAYNKLRKYGVKLKPDSLAQAIQAAEDKIDAKKMAADIMDRVVEPEPVAEDEPDPASNIEAERKPGLIVNEEFEAEFTMPEPPATPEPEPPADEYTLVFSPPEKFAELVVDKNGDVIIRNCEMDLHLRYVLKFKLDLTGLLVANDPKGFELRIKGNSFRIGCGAISKALATAGIDLPARYRLDIEEMTGVLL